MREKGRKSNLCKGKRGSDEMRGGAGKERQGMCNMRNYVQEAKCKEDMRGENNPYGSDYAEKRRRNPGRKGRKEKEICDIVTKTLRNSSERGC